MTPRERVEAALRAETPDKLPFTIYSNKLPRSQVELELRKAEVCLLEKGPGVLRQANPNVKASTVSYVDDDVQLTKTIFETPKGLLTEIWRPAPGTTWRLKYMFDDPDDYAAIGAMADRVIYLRSGRIDRMVINDAPMEAEEVSW